MQKNRTQSATTECNQVEFAFSRAKGRKVTADFQGGDISSDGGLTLIREVDRILNLSKRAASSLCDDRQQTKVHHGALNLLQSRLYGLCAGWEDLNDFDQLRKDCLYQSMTGRDVELASPATLCRFENQQNRKAALDISELLVDVFIESFDSAPEKLVLDFDATDDPVHGHQEKRFFHGYYNHHCFLPLYVFCGDQLLCAYLRPSNIDASKHTAAILKLLVDKLRKHWPKCDFTLRADSGFCRKHILRWCETHKVSYIIGIAGNQRLQKLAASVQQNAAEAYEATGQKQRLFSSFDYAARSWSTSRRIIHKAEHTRKGANGRFVVTNLQGDAQQLYDTNYCARGNMENRIKEQMLLFSDRTSAHQWWTNQYRLLLSALAYTLMEALRRLGLKDTVLEKAQVDTIRLKLIKIGAVITRNTRRVCIHLSQAYPLKELFAQLVSKLVPS